MATKKRTTDGSKEHNFGGPWTEQKLAILGDYLKSYATALQGKPFKIAYIDAFAGTGHRTPSGSRGEAGEGALFPELAEPEQRALLDGSARIAVKSEPRFDKYVFIESSAKRCRELERLKTEFPMLANDISVLRGDANERIRALCEKDWSARRAVLFLDPYGMQVEWKTIEAIAATRAIDLWILFPLGSGVNRLLTRTGDIPGPWHRRLDLLFGTTEWYNAFYRRVTEPSLFETEETRLVKVKMETVGQYFNARLHTIFPGVARHPRVLMNSANCPLYLLCFAVANESNRARSLALRIANHLLDRT